jgi:hypothetical protein
MIKANKSLIFGIFLLAVGLLMTFVSLTLIPMTRNVVSGTVMAVGQGAPVDMFQYYINGLLAGGYISIAPTWIVYTIGLFGLLFSYVGVYGIMNRDSNSPYLFLFTKSYWFNFQNSIDYKAPIVLKNKKIMPR